MFTELVESRRGRSPLGGQSIISLVVHAGLVLGAIGATRSVGRPPVTSPRIPAIVFTLPVAGPVARPAAAPIVGDPVRPSPDAPLPVSEVPRTIPTDLPPIAAGTPGDPKALPGTDRKPGGFPTLAAPGAPLPVGTVLLAAEADRPPELARGASCIGGYPPALRAMGVGGRAVLQFVIDTAGRVDSASVRVIGASHPDFGTAARAGILAQGCRYLPGEYRGQPVRVLVQQSAVFRAE